MIKKLDPKKKLILLGGGFLLALILVYTIAVSGTLELRSNCKSLNSTISSLEQAPLEIKKIEKRLLEMNRLLSSGKSGDDDFHEEFLTFLTTYCNKNNLIIKNFPKPHKAISNKYTIETNIVTFEGDYKELIELVYNLEISHLKGNITSVSFDTKPDFRNGIYKLNLTIYEQNIYNTPQDIN